MERYAAGDDAAFEAVYDHLAPRLAGYLGRRVRDRAVVEDIVQETFLHMHRARGSFIRGAEVLPWAFAIARRLMIDNDRVTRRQKITVLDGDDDGAVPAGMTSAATAEELMQAKQTAGRLHAELARLSHPQRDAFELLKNEGLSLAQAAAVLGTTVTAVKLRAHRAYLALRRALGDAALPPDAAPSTEEES
jgi:RNA polymerase sigma-70 factor (ECF subfamily)